jgi:hypothetical protein
MERPDKKIKSNKQYCGCLIDDLLEKTQEKNAEDRLCSARGNDVEVYVDPDVEKVGQDFYLRRLTDGLPIIPPTRERVLKFMEYTDRNPDDLIAVLPPRNGQATVEKIAINAVMAGCLPSFFPVVLHSIEAVSQEKFNLTGVNATTHPVAVCNIINGTIAHELGVNSGVGCLGPGNIANATIGRAVRLCLINLAGAVPGVGDHATMGSPAKFCYCFAEAEEDSPWDPLHAERGFSEDTSTVTLMAAEAPHNVNDHRSHTDIALLKTILHTASTAGCNNSHVPGEILVIMSPEHAQSLARDGWEKNDVQSYIHQNTLLPAELADRGGRKLHEKWIIDEDVRITRSQDDVILVVAGGPGRHTMISHGFGTSSNSIIIPLTLKDGSPVQSVQGFQRKK